MQFEDFFMALREPERLKDIERDAGTMRETLVDLAIAACESSNNSLWWLYVGLHDRYVMRFNDAAPLPGLEYMHSFDDLKKFNFPSIVPWYEYHCGRREREFTLTNSTPASAALLYKLCNDSERLDKTWPLFVFDAGKSPVWAFAPLVDTKYWYWVMQHGIDGVNSYITRGTSRLDNYFCPNEAWQWRCVFGGSLKNFISDNEAYAQLDKLRLSEHTTPAIKKAAEQNFSKQYPLDQVMKFALDMNLPLSYSREKSAEYKLPDNDLSINS